MITKSMYTRSLGLAVARGNGKSGYHIIPTGPHKWRVLAKGALRATKVFLNKTDAIRYAKKMAVKRMLDEIVIHDRNADVSKRISI